MCGIFGIIADRKINFKDLNSIVKSSRSRGRDSSGLLLFGDGYYKCLRSDTDIVKLFPKIRNTETSFCMGHSRLITNSSSDNQPIVSENVAVVHNGIIVNHNEIIDTLNYSRKFGIDTEAINAICEKSLEAKESLEIIAEKILETCSGTLSVAILFFRLGKLLLLSNNGSLYLGKKEGELLFASEEFSLKAISCNNIENVDLNHVVLNAPISHEVQVTDFDKAKRNLIPQLHTSLSQEKLLVHRDHSLRRCSKCILPETMPYIKFGPEGVCNYCVNYKIKNSTKSLKVLSDKISRYKRAHGSDCILPFSGGRDSCAGLHLAVKELGLKPITYTYDWGMVTDLGRRNIARMCGKLDVENIIVAADISKKRSNIRKNLVAWLRNPHLGMISILTAGDKHFFKYIEEVKLKTGISLNLWAINPLETTHFKAGFLGMPPDFAEEKVYTSKGGKQARYQWLRLQQMFKSPRYFNSSIFDTLEGEYWRTYHKKSDYFHIFDYYKWNEREINSILSLYDWEYAPDTSTSWRIGDGTAAFYNYIYYYVAGFTEHDTFRSNQIREGDISREEALELVNLENKPRYQNIKWYLDTLSLDFENVIKIVNNIKPMY